MTSCVTGKARRGARFNEGPAERIVHSVANRGHRTAAAAPGVFAPAVAFAAPEVRQDLGIGPAGRAFRGPAVVVEGMTPDVGHAVDRGRPAEPLAARLKDAATGEMFLRHRVVAPVPRAAFEVRSQGCWHSDRPVIRPSPGLDEQYPEIGVLAQTRRKHATSRSGAHDDVVELGHGRTRWLPVVGILRAMAGALDPVSLSGSIPRSPDAAIARSGSALIAARSSAVRRCGIVVWAHIRDGIRIAQPFCGASGQAALSAGRASDPLDHAGNGT